MHGPSQDHRPVSGGKRTKRKMAELESNDAPVNELSKKRRAQICSVSGLPRKRHKYYGKPLKTNTYYSSN